MKSKHQYQVYYIGSNHHLLFHSNALNQDKLLSKVFEALKDKSTFKTNKPLYEAKNQLRFIFENFTELLGALMLLEIRGVKAYKSSIYYDPPYILEEHLPFKNLKKDIEDTFPLLKEGVEGLIFGIEQKIPEGENIIAALLDLGILKSYIHFGDLVVYQPDDKTDIIELLLPKYYATNTCYFENSKGLNLVKLFPTLIGAFKYYNTNLKELYEGEAEVKIRFSDSVYTFSLNVIDHSGFDFTLASWGENIYKRTIKGQKREKYKTLSGVQKGLNSLIKECKFNNPEFYIHKKK